MTKLILVSVSLFFITCIFIYDNYTYYHSKDTEHMNIERYENGNKGTVSGIWKNADGTMSIEIDENLNINQYVYLGTYEERINETQLIPASNTDFSFANDNISLKLLSGDRALYKTPKKTCYLYKELIT